MSMLDTPEPPELYQGEGDGRLAPYDGGEMIEEDVEPETSAAEENGGITQEL